MASEETWKKLKYFRKDSKVDKWGDPDAIADETLLKLDDFRRDLGVPIYVLRGVATSGHKDGSYHYSKNGQEPCAVDIIVPDYQLTPFDLITNAARFGFTGIGYYPHWRWDGAFVGGLHVDCRRLKIDPDGTINYRHNRWMGVRVKTGEDENGQPIYKQEYIALTFHNIWKYTTGEEYVGNHRLP